MTRRSWHERDWEGVPALPYDDAPVSGAEKRELIGPVDGAPHWRLRHFHVPPAFAEWAILGSNQ